MALFAALPLLALAQPASAQSVSASSYRTTLDFAACAVAASQADARALIASTPASGEERALLAKLGGTQGCTDKANSNALRGAVAEKLYLATYPAAPAEPATGPAAPFKGSGVPELANWDLTRCVATRDPVGSDMLIRSQPGSAEQKEAFKRLNPVLAGCVPAGMQVGFDREKMRGLVAEGLIAVRAGSAAN